MGGRGSAGGAGGVEGRIQTAFNRLPSTAGGFQSLADLRDQLSGMTRAEQDTALRQMARRGVARIIPVANPNVLTARERAAALDIGGEPNEVIRIVRRRR